MNHLPFIRALGLLSGAATLALAAGCTSPSASHASSAGSTASGTNSAAVVWHNYVACARQHGQQSMPDPVVAANGVPTFPAVAGFDIKRAYRAVRASCGSILTGLPPQADPFAEQQEPLTPEQLRTVQQYVQCMRDHGMPDMPDPGPDGLIEDPPRYSTGPLRTIRDSARNACDHIILDGFR